MLDGSFKLHRNIRVNSLLDIQYIHNQQNPKHNIYPHSYSGIMGAAWDGTREQVSDEQVYCPGMYGQLMELPESCMSRISVSMGVLPTRRMKKSWEMRLAGTALRAGSRSRSRPKRCGWPGYCMRSYSVRATCAFSCRLSMCAGSDSPHASAGNRTKSLQHSCKWNGKLVIFSLKKTSFKESYEIWK